ncbi:MAG TPA: radical SAM protein [Candidatus Cloacimonadota bacterium]|nr:radical SAM protein [Candidatus Cloacimonadota bacterium]
MAISHLTKFVLRRPSMFFCSIRLTSLCSQNCMQCGIPSQSDGSFIATRDFAIIAGKLKKYGTRVFNLTGGEPALHPELEEIFRIASDLDFMGVNLLTNLYYPEARQEKVIELAVRYGIGIHTSYDGIGKTADTLRGAKDVQKTVERGMKMINALRSSGDYKHKPTATVVLSALNINQLSGIIQNLEELDWNMNIDLYRWGSSNHRETDLLKIKDPQQIAGAIQQIRKVKNLKTPLWYYDGILKHQAGEQAKQCPYLISPTFGSKFFVHENGDIHTCMSQALGNLLQDEIGELFQSNDWQAMLRQFENCQGCWNNCFTPSSRAMSYLHLPTLKQYVFKR